ncbi:MAG: carboxypeptidase regulatory-like domain-containing protein [Gemmatimonadota bacterium]|nr:carboxypeptidase regulatory-like domain-containing protein [Gemmatimonadota bacterium]
MSKRTAFLLAALCVAVRAPAQQVRGVVRDSSTGGPVVGVVVLALDSAGAQLARTIAGTDGAYRLSPRTRPVRLQALRIGFRPGTVAVPQGAGDATIDIRLASIPTLLDQVQVLADKAACPARADAVAAASLYQQARAGLLATVVAREAHPASVTRLAFDRTLDANGVRAVSQTVRTETADRATVSFNAVGDAADLASRGFTRDSAGHRTFLGPDADVLLDDAFAAAYCFHLAAPDRGNPGLVGLGFSPATRAGGRVDIDGTLWIDSVARRLGRVDFRYLGLDQLSTGFNAGGTVSFREVAPDIVLIDRWLLRLVGATDSAAARVYEVHEIGGELASASWADGRSWSASLGSARVFAKGTRATPVPPGTTLGLMGTDYRAAVDSSGTAAFTGLIPGPYAVMAVDPLLADLGLTIPAGASFVAARDSVITVEASVPTAAEFVATLCSATGRVAQTSAWLVARVAAADGRAADVRWRIARASDAGWETVVSGGSTGSTGLFAHCRNLVVGQTIQVTAGRPGEAPAVAVRKISGQLTALPLAIVANAPRLAAAGAPPADLAGIVLDSTTHTPVAGAFVQLLETQHAAVTDSAGAFRMVAVPRALYTAEVRTDDLDAAGAVGRTAVDFRTNGEVRVYVPTTGQVLAAMCGPSAAEGTGALVGAVMPPSGGPAPDGIRIVAEWADPASAQGARSPERRHWLKTRAGPDGSYRLCGVPVGTDLVVRTQLDSGAALAARPVAVRIDTARRWISVPVTLEAGLSLGASFAGVVVADSTDAPLGATEVSLPDIGRTALTNAAGAFRLDGIPPGTHRVTIRREGFAPITAQVAFADNQAVDHRVVLGHAPAALGPVTVTEAPAVNPEFDANRKLGLGKFLTTEDLDRNAGRRLSDVMAVIPNFGVVTQANAGHAWVVGKRAPAHLVKTRAGTDAEGNRVAQVNGGWFSTDDLRDLGMYCPANSAEQMQGITCACYAQVWVDGRLMNRQRPTEPFDVNEYPPERLQAVEWYGSASQTPAQYSSLNSPCGVLVLWTRRASQSPPTSRPGAQDQ